MYLTEYVRQNLKRMITRRFFQENEAAVITLDPKLEQLILERSKQNEAGCVRCAGANTDAVNSRQPEKICREDYQSGENA